MKRLSLAVFFVLAVWVPSHALASPCGEQAATMVRTYGLEQTDSPGSIPPGSTSTVSQNSATVNGSKGAPLTRLERQRLKKPVLDAFAADKAGDTAKCNANLDVAKAELDKY